MQDITVSSFIIRYHNPPMVSNAAVNCHIMMVHLKNNVLRCIVFDNGQIFPAEHDTSIEPIYYVLSDDNMQQGLYGIVSGD